MFELGITLAVVKRIDQLRVYTGNPYMGPHSRLAEIALAIEANFRIRRPELWAIGHEQWNSDAETDWVDLIMGRADMEALRFEAENVKPNGSGYSGQAYSGWRV